MSNCGLRALPIPLHNSWLTKVLQALTFTEREASVCAEHAAQAARYGQHSHNCLKLIHLLEEILFPAKMVVPGAQMRVVQTNPSLEVWDAQRAIGPAVATAATLRVVEMAKQTGFAGIAAYNCNHLLWGGDYALRGADAGCICGNFCQAAKSEVVPFGGIKPALGTNPITIAMPGAGLLDMATSIMSMGSVQQARLSNSLLPEGAAITAEGQPTRKPDEARYLLPFGGHKGSGLALFIELFFALVGSSIPILRGHREIPEGEYNTAGFFFFAIDPEKLAGDSYACGRSAAENLQTVIDSVITLNGHARMPGEKKYAFRERTDKENALLFPEHLISEFHTYARKYGVPFPAVDELRQI